MRHLFEALQLFHRHPRLWRYVAGPFVWTLSLFIAILAIGYFLFVPPAVHLFQRIGFGAASESLGSLFYLVVWIFISGIVYLTAVSFMSSLVWDRLSEEVEALLTGTVIRYRHRRTATAADWLKRIAFGLFMALLAFGSSFVLPIVAPLLIAGYVATLDVTASAFSRRGMLFRMQRRRYFRLDSWLSFTLLAGLFTLLPFVNALLIPIMVAAGTVMVNRTKSLA